METLTDKPVLTPQNHDIIKAAMDELGTHLDLVKTLNDKIDIVLEAVAPDDDRKASWSDRSNGNSVLSSDDLFCTVYLQKGTASTWRWVATHCVHGEHIGAPTFSKSSFSSAKKAKDAVADLMSFVENRTKEISQPEKGQASPPGELTMLAKVMMMRPSTQKTEGVLLKMKRPISDGLL